MTGRADEGEQARRLVERGERGRSDSGDPRPGTEPPKEWKGLERQPGVPGQPTPVGRRRTCSVCSVCRGR